MPSPGGIAFVSGQVGIRPDATAGIGAEQQTRIAFENIARVLAEAGLGLSDVASLRIYLTSHDHIEGFT
ncbi:RidA family protein [Brevibacterium album]|uniref:RidA family protein n=1 Tax=Brevibacterium album TaxID=417948 RepID=UPI000429874D|nr:RidA family protein [Brevibacterium album]